MVFKVILPRKAVIRTGRLLDDSGNQAQFRISNSRGSSWNTSSLRQRRSTVVFRIRKGDAER